MSINTKPVDTTVQSPTQEVPTARPAPRRLLSLLARLPPESVTFVERFVKFLHEQARQGRTVTVVSEKKEQPPYRYPTVLLPAFALDGLIGIMPPVGGDALADTEALDDEA